MLRSGRAGTTLPELMIVMMLVSALGSFVWPSIVGSQNSSRVRAASDVFIDAHALTRATAIRFGRVATLRIDPANRRFWVQADTGSGTFTVGSVQQLETGMSLSSPATEICFDGRGLRVSRGNCNRDTVNVVLSSANQTRTSRILPGGEVIR